MDWFRWVMLVFGIFFAASTLVILAKAIRRKEWQHLFELAVMSFWVFGTVLDAVSPTIIHNAWTAWSPLRWLYVLFAVLFLANFFGFSGWLFNRHRKQQI